MATRKAVGFRHLTKIAREGRALLWTLQWELAGPSRPSRLASSLSETEAPKHHWLLSILPQGGFVDVCRFSVYLILKIIKWDSIERGMPVLLLGLLKLLLHRRGKHTPLLSCGFWCRCWGAREPTEATSRLWHWVGQGCWGRVLWLFFQRGDESKNLDCSAEKGHVVVVY